MGADEAVVGINLAITESQFTLKQTDASGRLGVAADALGKSILLMTLVNFFGVSWRTNYLDTVAYAPILPLKYRFQIIYAQNS